MIERIDGLSPDEWMEKAEPYATMPKIQAREMQWQWNMPLLWNVHEAALRVRKRNDKVLDLKYRPLRIVVDDPRNDSPKMVKDQKRREHTEGRWIREGEVGYIRIPSFGEPHYADEALSYVRQYDSARAMIIDLRSNGGGYTPETLIEAFMDRPYRWWTETSPNIGYLHRRHSGSGKLTILPDGAGARYEGDWIEPSGRPFAGKVIVLVDRYVGSAAEDFLMPFKDTGRGILVGETTWGSTGQPVYLNYQDLQVGIGAIRAYMPDGTPFEGVGFQPDIPISRSRDDLYLGRDSVLEKALQLLE